MAKSPWTGSADPVSLAAGIKPIEGGIGGGSISGDLSGEVSSVIKSAGGKLSVSGGDGYAFLPGDYPGKFGALKISSEGDWIYSVDADNTQVKSLAGGSTLIDRLPVLAGGVNAIAVSIVEITVKSSGVLGYASIVLEDGPTLYWRLHETSGTVVIDSSGNGFDGQYRQDASLISTSGLTQDSDSAVFMRPPVSTAGAWRSSLPIMTGTSAFWTAEVIVKLDNNPPNGQTVWQLGANGGGCPALAVAQSSTGKYRVYVAVSGSSNIITSASEFVWGGKALIHVIQRLGGVDLYVNGVLEGSVDRLYSEYRYGVMRVGYAKFASDEYPCNGVVDEFALYSKALTADRIAARVAAL